MPADLMKARRLLIEKRRKGRNPRKPKEPRGPMRLYAAYMERWADEIVAAVEKELIPLLRSEFRADAIPERLKAPLAELRARFTNAASSKSLIDAIRRFAVLTSTTNQRELRRVLGIAVPGTGTGRVFAWVDHNVELIRNATQEQMAEIAAVIEESLRKGRRHEEVAELVRQKAEVTKSRARLIARDQVLTLNSNLNRERQQAVGVDYYQWSTSGDERVRDEHAALNGEIFRWDQPPSIGHPGEPINCRCVAIPVLPELGADALPPS